MPAASLGRCGWVIVGLVVAACSAEVNEANLVGESAYFPREFAKSTVDCGLGRPMEIVSDFEAQWYSEHLAAAREPSLYRLSSTPEGRVGDVLRFTWLRTFDAPVIVRVKGIGSDAPRLIAKELSGQGGYGPGQIKKSIERNLNTLEIQALATVMAKARVFDLPPKDCALGCDGSQWVIEGIDRGRYRFVGRWSPKNGGVRELGQFMVGLTGWSYKDVY